MTAVPVTDCQPVSIAPPKARVTVVIPTYNRPDFLRQALSSVLAQTYQDFVVLVWNDGGDDAAASVVSALADQRITYHRSPRNQGCMRAAVSAWSIAQSDYIAHLDDDDEWAPEFLSTLVPFLEANGEVALAFCDHWIADESGSVMRAQSDRNSRRWGRLGLVPGLHQPARAMAIRGVIPVTRGSLVRRSAISSLTSPDLVSEGPDRWIAYLATRNGLAAAYVPERLALSRNHRHQVTRRVASVAALESEARMYRIFLTDPTMQGLAREITRRLAKTTSYWCIALLGEARIPQARVVARRGLATRVTARTIAAAILAATPPSLSTPSARVLAAARGAWRRVAETTHPTLRLVAPAWCAGLRTIRCVKPPAKDSEWT